ncbi:MAG: monovalent cation/H(+) antiporter subunit G [Rhodospirillaceae bacterium]|nr:monovalent cation/H(+) antiporter subunit G [Rhodospirillaceae bacterium]
MSLAVDILSWALMLGGGFFMLVSGVGMLRLPDLFTRLHGASVADTGGAALLLLGMALQAGFTLVTVKLLLIGIFLFFTTPTASHAVAHAALIGGLSPDDPAKNQHPDEDGD